MKFAFKRLSNLRKKLYKLAEIDYQSTQNHMHALEYDKQACLNSIADKSHHQAAYLQQYELVLEKLCQSTNNLEELSNKKRQILSNRSCESKQIDKILQKECDKWDIKQQKQFDAMVENWLRYRSKL